jgi:hypothetical protein
VLFGENNGNAMSGTAFHLNTRLFSQTLHRTLKIPALLPVPNSRQHTTRYAAFGAVGIKILDIQGRRKRRYLNLSLRHPVFQQLKQIGFF